MKAPISIAALSFAALALSPLGGCSDASVASRNLSAAADNFEIRRRIVFFNGITDSYLMTIEGLCSIAPDKAGSKLDVTCKVGDGVFKKHFLGLSDNVSYFAEQMEPGDVSAHHYRVVFKPQVIVPDIDVRGDLGDLPRSQ